MREQNVHQLSEHVRTYTAEGLNGWYVGFWIQQQGFSLSEVSAIKGDEDDTEEHAKWMQNNLDFALNKIIKTQYEEPLQTEAWT